VFTVFDANDQEQVFALAAKNGAVLCNGPRWWRADPDVAAAIAAKLQAVSELARQQRGS
jgi:hypothetical protein